MPPAARIHIRLAAIAAVLLAAAALVPRHTAAGPAQDKKSPEAGRKQAAEEEPVRLHSDLVIVNVTVVDSAGHYVHGLAAADFSVREDGAPQTVDSFISEEAPFAAAILIDMSGSMGHKFGLVRGAAASFMDHIRDSDQVAVYGFNNEVRMFQDFSNSRDIHDHVWDAEAENVTRMYDCMEMAIEALKNRPEKRRALVLISDGWDSSSKASYESILKSALNEGVTVYTLDLVDDNLLIGNASYVAPLRRGRAIMQSLAGETGGRYVHSPQGAGLEKTFTNIVDELRNQYTLAYYSSNNKRDGKWRKLSVGVSRGGASVRARKGYYAPKDR